MSLRQIELKMNAWQLTVKLFLFGVLPPFHADFFTQETFGCFVGCGRWSGRTARACRRSGSWRATPRMTASSACSSRDARTASTSTGYSMPPCHRNRWRSRFVSFPATAAFFLPSSVNALLPSWMFDKWHLEERGVLPSFFSDLHFFGWNSSDLIGLVVCKQHKWTFLIVCPSHTASPTSCHLCGIFGLPTLHTNVCDVCWTWRNYQWRFVNPGYKPKKHTHKKKHGNFCVSRAQVLPRMQICLLESVFLG